eukprot:TRINITY_DN32636_c0_g1_i1.p1 TRINITY_DN32636_c0_g1~~TRINITY_DN32636_c0_g1_i1.p1  ORF type:complete len:575 (-),score=98.94 TRINITY_DN32636_c0_g1_i1:122-1846(-)
MAASSEISDDWSDVGVSNLAERQIGSALAYLNASGLSAQAARIIEVTEAETVEDLKLIDAAMAEEVIKQADLKLVSAKKFRNAVGHLHGNTVVDPAQASVETVSPAEVASTSETIPKAALSESASAPQEPQECIAICIDHSGSMGAPFAEVTLNVVDKAKSQRTRMEAVKVMFYAFRDRVENVGKAGSHELGLIQFDDRVTRLLDLTPRLDRFEAIVDDVEYRGQTSIYSAIIEATQMLEVRFREDSPTDLRILVLTDGQNNCGVSAQDALLAVNRIGAVVDAIIVGDSPDANLRRIVSATEGECYQIQNLGEGFELLEAESVVSLRARRGGEEKPPFKRREAVDLASTAEKSMTSGNAVQRAPETSKSHAAAPVVDLKSLGGTAAADLVKGPQAAGGPGERPSAKRIRKELGQVASGETVVWKHRGDGVHIFPAPDNIHFWRALIEGPTDSPFEGGVFALEINIPDDYPFKPPRIIFMTPIKHCNVGDSGQICLDVLKDAWSPSFTVPQILEIIRFMLGDPNTDDALRQWIAELTLAHKATNGADTRYYDMAREFTRQEASLTVAEFKAKWSC